VTAPGARRRLGFACEDALGRRTSRQQAAYLDLGVEHGIAAARANQLPGASKQARAIAEQVVREVVGTGVAPHVRLEAAVLAAWALLDRTTDLREGRGTTPSTSPSIAGSTARGSNASSPRTARPRRPAY
jgi:hypothetical protein